MRLSNAFVMWRLFSVMVIVSRSRGLPQSLNAVWQSVDHLVMDYGVKWMRLAIKRISSDFWVFYGRVGLRLTRSLRHFVEYFREGVSRTVSRQLDMGFIENEKLRL